MRRKVLTASAFLCIFVTVLFSQQSTQDEPEVELPELILRFDGSYTEELPVLDISTDEVLQPGELEDPEMIPDIGTRNFDPALPVPDYQTLPYGTDSAPLFGRGYIGLGSANSLWGEVEIATLGTDPGFGLSYSHKSLDGFGSAAPGEGFTVRREEARGAADYSFLGGAFSFDGTFIEEERGLQQQSTFSSTLYRDMGIKFGYEKAAETGWFWSADASLSGIYQNLSGTTPLDDTHMELLPSGQAGYAWKSVRLGLAGVYDLRSSSEGDAGQIARALLSLEADISPSVGISADVGAGWDSAKGPGVPFSLRGTFGLSRSLTMEASGGYFYRPALYSPLFAENPFLSLPEDPLGVERGWEADLSFRLRLGTGKYLTLASGFVNGSLYCAAADYDPVSHLLPVELQDVGEFTPRGRLDFSLGEAIYAGIQSELRYDYLEADLKAAELGFSLKTDTPTARTGFSFDAGVNLLEPYSMPVLGASAWLEPIDSVRFILQGEDFLAPLEQDGRIDDSGLELPGLILRLAAEISL